MLYLLEIENSPIVFILIGLLFLCLPFIISKKSDRLKSTGIQVEGIIFETEPIHFSFGENDHNHHATVRFVTENNEWITTQLTSKQLPVFITSQFKEGTKVRVYYNPKDPNDFIIESPVSKSLINTIFIVAGFGLILVGLYILFLGNSEG